jgi:hypothetical protein
MLSQLMRIRGKIKPHSVDATGVLEPWGPRGKPHEAGKLPVEAGLFFDFEILVS